MSGFVATQTVHTAEGAIVGPGEETGEKFDPDAEHNAALIEQGLLRPSESSQSASKASDGGSDKKSSGKA